MVVVTVERVGWVVMVVRPPTLTTPPAIRHGVGVGSGRGVVAGVGKWVVIESCAFLAD